MAKLNFNIFSHKGQDGSFFEISAIFSEPFEYSNSRILLFCEKFCASVERAGWKVETIVIFNIVENEQCINFRLNAPRGWSLKKIEEDLSCAIAETAEAGNLKFGPVQKRS